MRIYTTISHFISIVVNITVLIFLVFYSSKCNWNSKQFYFSWPNLLSNSKWKYVIFSITVQNICTAMEHIYTNLKQCNSSFEKSVSRQISPGNIVLLWHTFFSVGLLLFERVLLLSIASPPRSRGRCSAAIRLSHRPEPSGRVVCGGAMDWAVEDDMVDCLFRAILTGRRGDHTPFLQAGAETSDTGAEAVEPDPGSSWEGHSRGGVPVSGIEVQSLVGLSAHSAFHWWSAHCAATYVVVVRWTDELLCGGYKWVSRFKALCSCTRWTGERWVEQVSRLHGTAS